MGKHTDPAPAVPAPAPAAALAVAIGETRIVALADLAATKADLVTKLPEGASLSTRKGGRGCPEGCAVVAVVAVEGAA